MVAASSEEEQMPHHVQMLLAVRQRYGWSQTDLASALMVSRRTIVRWESGRPGEEPRPFIMAALRELLLP